MNVRYMANTAIEEGFFCRITKLQKCHSRYEASEVFLNFFLMFPMRKSLTPKWCISNEEKNPITCNKIVLSLGLKEPGQTHSIVVVRKNQLLGEEFPLF